MKKTPLESLKKSIECSKISTQKEGYSLLKGPTLRSRERNLHKPIPCIKIRNLRPRKIIVIT